MQQAEDFVSGLTRYNLVRPLVVDHAADRIPAFSYTELPLEKAPETASPGRHIIDVIEDFEGKLDKAGVMAAAKGKKLELLPHPFGLAQQLKSTYHISFFAFPMN